LRVAAVAVLATLLAHSAGLAQNLLPTGNFYGTVVDEKGAPIAGVSATLRGPGAPWRAHTDARGEFRFLNLPPGIYALTLELSGLASIEQPGISISVGRDTVFRETMRLASVTEEVAVSGSTPSSDPRKTITGANFAEIEMQRIPTSRDVWALLRQVPGVVLDQTNVGGNKSGIQPNVASRGSTQIEYELDGVTITDPADGGSPTYFNFDSLQEVQIATGGSDPTLRGDGVTLNLVTKRGTNSLRGLAQLFYAPDRWQSDNTPPEARQQGFQSNRSAQLRDYGVEAGGPIIKDRIWAWGAWGENVISLDQVGVLPDSGQTLRATTTLEQRNFKLDARISASNETTFFYQHGDKRVFGRRDVAPGTPVAVPFVAADAARDQRGPTPLYKIEDSNVFSSTFIASAFLSYLPGGFELVPEAAPDTQAYGDANGVLRGSNLVFRTSRKQRQAGATISKFLETGRAAHELKFGFGYRGSTVSSSSSWPGGGLVGDESREAVSVTRAANVRLRTETFSAYLTDTLTLDRLTVNAGLRYDYGRSKNLPSAVATNAVFPGVLPAIAYGGDSGYPISSGSVQPRLGATYALDEKRRTLLRASYARFSNQGLADVFAANVFPGVQYITVPWQDANGNNRVDPGEVDFSACAGTRCDPDRLIGFANLDPSNTGTASSPNIVGSDLKPSTTDEIVAGLDRQLATDLTASVAYTYRNLRDFTFAPFIGITAQYYGLLGQARGTVTAANGFVLDFSVPFYGLTLAAPPVGVVLRNRPDYHQTYQGVELQVVKRLSHGWMARASAAWNDWKQHVGPGAVFDPNDRETNLDGDAATGGFARINARWQFNVSGLCELPWGLAASANFFGREGFPQRYFVRVQTHDVAQNVADILVGQIGDHRLGNVYELDLRLEKTLAVGPLRVVPSLDVFNITNENTVLSRRSRIGTFDPKRTPAFQQFAFFDQITEVQSPRILRAGVRISF
jgi:hypothetical protein